METLSWISEQRSDGWIDGWMDERTDKGQIEIWIK